VFLTGYTLNSVANYDPSAASSSSITHGPTASAMTSSKPGKSSSSAGGIAAGVIVAVLVVAAIFGGVLFYFRRKRAQEDGVEEIRDQKDMSFGGAGGRSAVPVPAPAQQAGSGDRPGMWAPDSRMDSGTAAQRVSTGSIADNQDFSRRILQVCVLIVSKAVADGVGAKPGRVLSRAPPPSPFSTSRSTSPSSADSQALLYGVCFQPGL
jgi:cell wall integrity and stress response component